MKREWLFFFALFRRPSVLLSLILIFIQIYFSDTRSLYGMNLKSVPWIHEDSLHLLNNLCLWLPLAFLNENKIGNLRAILYAVFSLLLNGLVWLLPFAPVLKETDIAIGFSAMIASQVPLLAMTRRSIQTSLFALLLATGMLYSGWVPDPISRFGHGMGLIVGLILAPLSVLSLNRSQSNNPLRSPLQKQN